MELEELKKYYNKFKYGEESFHKLMQNRIKKILLVSSFYDAFTFEQDGRLSEKIFGEYRQLNLSLAPRVTSVPTAKMALKELEKDNYDLVVTMKHIGKMSFLDLARQIKENYKALPLILLLSSASEARQIKNNKKDVELFDKIFLWNGDAKLFLAMIKSVEDRDNLANDTREGLVRVILLVEDSVKYYSMILPYLYERIVEQTQILIREEVNDINKRLRMRARPKVIVAHSYEEAISIYRDYSEYISTVISDIKFPHNEEMDEEAGLKLISNIKSNDDFDIPIILMSSELDNKELAEKFDVTFLHKFDPQLINKIGKFIHDYLGFGEFILKDEQGYYDTAHSLSELRIKLQRIPDSVLKYHTVRNHFSSWLMARGEIEIARKIRPLRLQDFGSISESREYLLNTINNILDQREKGKVIKYHDYCSFEPNEIIQLRDGSLGGKGRGLAFLNALLVSMDFGQEIEDCNIVTPPTAIIGTNEFDDFIENNNLDEMDIEGLSDEQINRYFLAGQLTDQLLERLGVVVSQIDKPLAVRSSGLLEDSYSEPFAGIYRTYMLPNNDPQKSVRIQQLITAVKLVFASVYTERARMYINNLNHRISEEKMAVIIQEITGSCFDEKYYYPHISGVAQSYNFYPVSDLDHEDGVVSIAAGLGKSVVDGENTYRFCPKYPDKNLLKRDSLIKDSQKFIFALNLKKQNYSLVKGDDITLDKIGLEKLRSHGSLKHLASVLDMQNNRIRPGLRKDGPIVMNFDYILKYNYFPLAEIVDKIMELGEAAFGMPIEIEFAVDLQEKQDEEPTFYLLQIRPLAVGSREVHIPDKIDENNTLLYSEHCMGNGQFCDLEDVIFITSEDFDKTETMAIRNEVKELNAKMREKGNRYLLIGPGRWGSQDRFLGIPVQFNDINMAKVIVETGFEGFEIEPSQGTHFFHNVVSMELGYISVPHSSTTDYLHWDWLKKQGKVAEDRQYCKHVKLPGTMNVKMDGKSGRGIITIENCD
ncbi:MAG: hypothetical protein K9M80_06030 [Candidatus Marinimicrobia bacterium]|nr:hypothetical protein [Candidatus Neomarinimicrobiota bacterium]